MVAKKDDAARIRRNKEPSGSASAKVVLPRVPAKAPKVPAHTNKTRWVAVWSDPSSSMWSQGDHGLLIRWCHLADVFLIVESPVEAAKVSAEMRSLELQLGLGAVARAKLGWAVEAPASKPASNSSTPAGSVVDSAARFRARAKG